MIKILSFIHAMAKPNIMNLLMNLLDYGDGYNLKKLIIIIINQLYRKNYKLKLISIYYIIILKIIKISYQFSILS